MSDDIHEKGGWWIATGFVRTPGARRLLGPFETRDLALDVRSLYEIVHAPATFYVDRWPADA